MPPPTRRALLGAAALIAGTGHVRARMPVIPDTALLGWPRDPAAWDPTQDPDPGVQALFRLVFDPPITLDPGLALIPSIVAAWTLSEDATSLTLDLRDDVLFHDGQRLTSADLAWTLHGRAAAGRASAFSAGWPWLADIETPGPDRAILRFSEPVPTAPVRLAAPAAFILPAALSRAGAEADFSAHPIGTGPYRVVSMNPGARIELERNEAYWGTKPKLRRIAIDAIGEPGSRLAAIEAGRVDLTLELSPRDMARLAGMPGLASELTPITRMMLLQARSDQGFADPNIRLAAHHAIDKAALSRGLFGGAAPPLDQPATPGTPGYAPGYAFAYDPALARALLGRSGYGPSRPAPLRLGATNGAFPGDIELARAIRDMWRTVGIAAEIEVFERAKYVDLNRANYLPDATLLSWDNQTGDPVFFIGALLDPTQPFCAWRDMALGQKIIDAGRIVDAAARQARYRALGCEASDIGALMPLLQGVQSVARKRALGETRYGNGWVLGQDLAWS